MSTVELLRERWIAKRNAWFRASAAERRALLDAQAPSRAGQRNFAGDANDYARRELRAYRLAQAWARDTSLPGTWWWVRRDQRWDVYPQQEPCKLMRVTVSGAFHSFFHPDGSSSRIGFILDHRAGVSP